MDFSIRIMLYPKAEKKVKHADVFKLLALVTLKKY